MSDRPKCGARKKSGDRCGLPAGHGTDHVGHGQCKLHGGATPNARKAAQRAQAAAAVATLGLPREVEPHEALLEEVHRAAGHVAWLSHVVADLERQQVVHGITRTVQTPDGRTVTAQAALNVWVRLYQDERDRLTRAAKMAIDAGVAERYVELAEGQAEQLARVVRAIVTDLGHSLDDDNVREVVRLRLIEGGKAT